MEERELFKENIYFKNVSEVSHSSVGICRVIDYGIIKYITEI